MPFDTHSQGKDSYGQTTTAVVGFMLTSGFYIFREATMCDDLLKKIAEQIKIPAKIDGDTTPPNGPFPKDVFPDDVFPEDVFPSDIFPRDND